MQCVFTYTSNLLCFNCCECLMQSEFMSPTDNIYCYTLEYLFLRVNQIPYQHYSLCVGKLL